MKRKLSFTSKTSWLVLAILIISNSYTYSQQKDFNFGFQGAFYFSQIEGDNLIGFNKLSYGLGLLGGYNFNENTELIVSGLYENIGSSKSGAKTTGLTDKSLAQINLRIICLHLAFAKRFGDSWEGDHKYRISIGPKLNNILNQESRLFSGKLEKDPEFMDSDFKSRYVSLRVSLGLIILNNTILDFVYDHSLQNILRNDNQVGINKLVPFYIGLNLSHYL